MVLHAPPAKLNSERAAHKKVDSSNGLFPLQASSCELFFGVGALLSECSLVFTKFLLDTPLVRFVGDGPNPSVMLCFLRPLPSWVSFGIYRAFRALSFKQTSVNRWQAQTYKTRETKSSTLSHLIALGLNRPHLGLQACSPAGLCGALALHDLAEGAA